MEQVLFGDIFINIERYLFPINLHILLQTCKKYNKMITKDIIQINTVNEIKRRLRKELGKDYEEFVEAMNKVNAVLVRQFIAQCLLGEEWTRNCITICILETCYEKNGGRLNKFLSDNEYDIRKGKRTCYNNL